MESSALILFSSNTIYIIAIGVIVAIIILLTEFSGKSSLKNKSGKVLRRAPGPRPLPVIGNLISLDGYEVPYQAFGDLAKKFGPIISLKLGSIPAIVVNGIDNIKEVLIAKSASFDSRPNFRRYHQLFCGNKENSLAFCDWSDVQKLRRDMLVQHTFPKSFSLRFKELDNIINFQMNELVDEINQGESGAAMEIKPLILNSCANIFTEYLCSRTFDKSNPKFQKMISNFDDIFYEVNQGYAADFLPFLLPLHKKNLKQLERWSQEIREFILENIIQERFDEYQINGVDNQEPRDYVDSLIDHVKRDAKPTLEWDTALFALEDMVGGHSAVGNFLVKVFGYIAQNPNVQTNIQEEIDRVLGGRQDKNVSLNDRNHMVYTEAVILEAIRLIASPIVPHVANCDSTISGFDVEKGTLIFLNNHDLSMSEKYWENPEEFEPKRFLQSGRLIKPDYFLPFGAGRRSCMGYKMVQFISFSIVSTILQNFNIKTLPNVDYKIPAGSLAMSSKPFIFESRLTK